MLLKDSNTDQKKSKVCKFFASGRCIYGDKCRFLHAKATNVAGFTSELNQEQNDSKEVRNVAKHSGDKIGTRRKFYYHNNPLETSSINPTSRLQVDNLCSECKNDSGVYCGAQVEKQNNDFSSEQKPHKVVCRYYARGYCGRGEKCPFLHERKDFNKKDTKISGENYEDQKVSTNYDHQDNVEPSLNEGNSDTNGFSSVNVKNKNSGIQNFNNDRKAYLRRYSVPKFIRESQQRGTFLPSVQKTPEELRRLEMDLLVKKFPEAEKVEVDDGSSSFQFTFVPGDPDWPFDVKEFELVAEFTPKYPLEAMKLRLGNNEAIPDSVKSQLEKDICEWINTKHDSSNSLDLAFRPLMRWLDRSMEELLTSALKEYKRELILAASGIQIISASQLREKYKGAVPKTESTNDESSMENDTTKPVGDAMTNGMKPKEHKEDTETYDEDEEEINAPVAMATIEPIKKGTEARLNSLELSGIAMMLCSKLKVTMSCGRCSNRMDVSVAIPGKSDSATFTTSCPFCNSKGSAQFNRCIIHNAEHSMGYFNLEGCQVADVILSDCEFLVTCFKCMKNMCIKSLFPGQQSDTWCMECHQKLTIRANNVKVLRRLDSNAPLTIGSCKTSAQVDSNKKPKNVKDPAIQDGKPLPAFGTCKHYKKSFRWFRFPCCGKAYPCDLCHEQAETHEMKLANRIICGYCALEQNYTPSNPCTRCGGHVTSSFTSHWEGGKGCRDKIRMNKGDSKKYSNCSKTVPSSGQKKQSDTKNTKLRHAD